MVGFSGGEKLTAHMASLQAKVTNSGTLEVGFLEGATYPDGTPVPLVAYMNEFGNAAKGQPPRPFFRGMIAKESGHWGEDVAALLREHDMDAGQSLALMGQEIEGELHDSIIALDSPPLAPSTIKAKGSSKPLIDTGVMLRSIASRVDPA